MGRPAGQTNMQLAAAASEQTAASAASSREQQQAVSQPTAGLFFAALLCSTSSPAETRLTVYRRSQHFSCRDEGSTSLSGGNQVDGLPPAPVPVQHQSACQLDRA